VIEPVTITVRRNGHVPFVFCDSIMSHDSIS